MPLAGMRARERERGLLSWPFGSSCGSRSSSGSFLRPTVGQRERLDGGKEEEAAAEEGFSGVFFLPRLDRLHETRLQVLRSLQEEKAEHRRKRIESGKFGSSAVLLLGKEKRRTWGCLALVVWFHLLT